MSPLTITYEGTNFNAEHLAKKSEVEFLAEFENTKVFKDYSPEDRTRLLKESYAKCVEAVKKAGKPVYVQPVAETVVEQPAGEQPTDLSEAPPKETAGRKNK